MPGAAHHTSPLFPKSSGNPTGGVMPIVLRAATASACGGVPDGPAAGMQPEMAARLGALRQQPVVGTTAATAGKAASRRRAFEIPPHPLDDAAFEGTGVERQH